MLAVPLRSDAGVGLPPFKFQRAFLSRQIDSMTFYGCNTTLPIVFRCWPGRNHDSSCLKWAKRTYLTFPVTMELSQVVVRLNYSSKKAASAWYWRGISVRWWGTHLRSLDTKPSSFRRSTTVDCDTHKLPQADVLSVADPPHRLL